MRERKTLRRTNVLRRKIPFHKLSPEKVREIRRLYALSRRELAKMFGVAKSTIQRWTNEQYRKREMWKAKRYYHKQRTKFLPPKLKQFLISLIRKL